MTPYQKEINMGRITTFLDMKSKGLTISRPFMDLSRSPPVKKKKPLSQVKEVNTSSSGSGNGKSDDMALKRSSKRVREKESVDYNESKNSPLHKKPKSSEKEGRSSKKSKPPKQIILECHQEFINASCLDKNQKAFIKHYLQSPINQMYNVLEILKDSENLDDEIKFLVRDGVLFKKPLSNILQALVDHLYSLVKNPNLVVPDMREALAVSIVASYPKLAQRPVQEGDMPWTWLYNRKKNTGKIANIVQNRQRKQKEKRLRGGGTEKRKKGPKPVINISLMNTVPDSELSKEVCFLRLLVDNDRNKPEIETKMDETFEERRNIIEEGKYTTSAYLVAFPQLKSFKGEMIDFEFKKIFPGKEHNLLLNWGVVSGKIVHLVREMPNFKSCFKFKDDALNAILVLTKYLPTTQKCYQYENQMNPDISIEDYIQVEPAGTNIQNAIETRRQESKFPIQPYLLAIGTHEKIEVWCLVLGDSHSIGLPASTKPTRALDLLLKAFYVLNLHFPLRWKHVYRFVFSHVYGIAPENDKLSNFYSEWLAIENVKC